MAGRHRSKNGAHAGQRTDMVRYYLDPSIADYVKMLAQTQKKSFAVVISELITAEVTRRLHEETLAAHAIYRAAGVQL